MNIHGSRHSAAITLIALLLLASRLAHAGSSVEKQVKYDYLEKVLTLRHFYSGDHLSFNSDGTLQGNAGVGPWTLDGQIEVDDIHLRAAQVLIKGRRIHLIAAPQSTFQDQLKTIDGNDKKNKDLEKELRGLKVEIAIQLSREQADEKDVASAIDAVFLTSSEAMSDIVPSYWRGYFLKKEGKAAPEAKVPSYAFKPGTGTSPPHVIFQPDPDYSDEARKAKYQGTAVMSMIVDPSGAPTDLQIQRPLGLGLDEKAVTAISTWKFEPAQKDGNPVSAKIYVEVSFRLY